MFKINHRYKLVQSDDPGYLAQVGRCCGKHREHYVHLIIETRADQDEDGTWYRYEPRRVSFLQHSTKNVFVDVTNKCEHCLKEAMYRALRDDGKLVCETCI